MVLEYDGIGEKLIQPADSGGCVEIWLDQIQTAMRKTMALILDQSLEAYALPLLAKSVEKESLATRGLLGGHASAVGRGFPHAKELSLVLLCPRLVCETYFDLN